ncbi:transcriptional regulator [Deinococcus malanensis]|uniref:Transcriptional regulator n=1 Tax=Deinococcus malanensis TaxID=1706855 RepID=A0ABQ2ESR8_9DEIO|nr:metalloregulator ArsR/SmtB family transcription factor [Deinococcus malanensis]GGK18827.1 transcriptional regulator [Deinococcus malanensis]
MATLAPPKVFDQVRALAHEIRFDLVRHLAQGERCVCDLEDLLDLPQSKVSYHLNILRETGLIHSEQRGKNVYYRLEPRALYQLGGVLLTEIFESDRALTHQTKRIC